MKQIEL